MTQDAGKTTFAFDGTAIGGVESYTLFEGTVQQSSYKPLDGSGTVAFPTPPDFGQFTLNLISDKSDAGQVKLLASLRGRTRATMVVTYPDASTDTFTAFTLLYQERGSKTQADPIERVRCVMRVSGTIS